MHRVYDMVRIFLCYLYFKIHTKIKYVHSLLVYDKSQMTPIHILKA